MFGYTVTALRVVRKGADDAPLQVDNIDGQGLDLAVAWREHFRRPQAEHQIRARRYWQSARATRPVNRNGTPWVRLEIEYGSNGVPGRVVDTASRAETAQVRPQDATLSTYRHLLTRPRGGSGALLAGEQIGRNRALSGPLDAFRKAFEASQPDLRVTIENVADGEYWEQFIAIGDLMSATAGAARRSASTSHGLPGRASAGLSPSPRTPLPRPCHVRDAAPGDAGRDERDRRCRPRIPGVTSRSRGRVTSGGRSSSPARDASSPLRLGRPRPP